MFTVVDITLDSLCESIKAKKSLSKLLRYIFLLNFSMLVYYSYTFYFEGYTFLKAFYLGVFSFIVLQLFFDGILQRQDIKLDKLRLLRLEQVKNEHISKDLKEQYENSIKYHNEAKAAYEMEIKKLADEVDKFRFQTEINKG